jgi:hypothetical protein
LAAFPAFSAALVEIQLMLHQQPQVAEMPTSAHPAQSGADERLDLRLHAQPPRQPRLAVLSHVLTRLPLHLHDSVAEFVLDFALDSNFRVPYLAHHLCFFDRVTEVLGLLALHAAQAACASPLASADPQLVCAC